LSQIERIRLTVLVEDTKNTNRPNLMAKHGLSFFIELKSAEYTRHLLLDTGPSANLVLENAQKLGIDLKKLDYIVLSHGHYDHTGGLLSVLKYIDKRVPVILHPDALEPKFSVKKKRLKKIGLPCSISELKETSGILIPSRGASSLMPGVWVSGEIKRITSFEKVKGFRIKKGDKLVDDNMLDDQAIFVMFKNKELVVITGCAHAGLINTIKQARRITSSSRAYAVIGGFHLSSANTKRIRATTEELQRLGVEFLMPCHCTGRTAITNFVAGFGKNCQRLRTGDSIVF